MEFTKVQDRFVKQKSVGYQLVKGKKGTGKSTLSIYRAINLENNYCIYNEDRILFVTSDYNKTNEAIKLYTTENNKNHFYSLFSLEKERVEIFNLEEIINTYSNAYRRENGLSLLYIDNKNGITILKEMKNDIEELSKKSKFLKSAALELIYNEILWIKACKFTLEEYLEIDRKGRSVRIKKNSYTREALYSLMEKYNETLRSMGYMDKYDQVIFSTNYANAHNIKYSHIILDDCERLTRGEIEFIKSIYANEPYSSIIFIVNTELHNDENSWLIKGRKIKTLGRDFKGKTFNFRVQFEAKKVKQKVDTIDKYQYINLKNKNIIEFNIDTAANNKEIFLDEKTVYEENELADIPMFNNIAAGTPIEMNDNIEGSFFIPKQWLERGKETFILRVKGDSMVDKNICDGDLVVIKKESMANHNDIVAASIDGEATLKTLNLNNENPMLMPANSMYSPIIIQDQEVNILGVAIGVIKQ